MKRAAVACIALCTSIAASPQPVPAPDWAEIAIDDLHFIRAILRENHPGPVDTENPWFRDWYEQGFDEARTLAAQAKNYAGYFFAIQYYMSGFQDGHLGALGDDRLQNPRLERQWAGVILGLEGEHYVVATADSSFERAPPVGARLTRCDSHSASELARNTIEPYFTLWSVPSVRPPHAPFLLVSEGNPFVRRPTRCTFELDGKRITRELEWRKISGEALADRIARALHPASPPIELRRFADNGYWISASSFSGNAPDTVSALQALIDALESNADAIRSSDLGSGLRRIH